MTEDLFKAKLAEALDRISTLPEGQRGPLLAILAETQRRHEQLKQSFAKIHDALSEWRLLVKYLVFDYEATQRERDDLRRRLDGREP